MPPRLRPVRPVAEPLTLAVDANTLVRKAGNPAGVRFLGDPALSLVMTEYTFAEAQRHIARRVAERVAKTPLPPEQGSVLLAQAQALELDLPIWTNDTHFWGCGVAVWTDDSLARHLASGFA